MNLEELEARLQALIEVRLVNALAGQKKEDLIVQKLSAAMQANLLVQEDEVRLAPHVFTIVVNPASIAHWQDLRLFETLVEILKALELEKGLRFSSPSMIRKAFSGIASLSSVLFPGPICMLFVSSIVLIL